MKSPSNIRKHITDGQAFYVVDRLIETRQISERAVLAIVAEIDREMADVKRQLAEYYRITGRNPKGLPRARSVTPATPRRKPASPELAESRRIQGEYMGLIRQLNGAARTKIRKLAAEEGRSAAIKAMRSSG